MTERAFRLIIGLSLLCILYFDFRNGMIALVALLVFEGVTNWRIPLLVSRLRYGVLGLQNNQVDTEHECRQRINFDSERALRIVFSGVIVVTYFLFNETLWLIPWFAGFALAVAGLSGICPMLIFLEKVGFKPERHVVVEQIKPSVQAKPPVIK